MSDEDPQADDEILDEAIHCFRSMPIQYNPPAELSRAVLADLTKIDARASSPAVCQPVPANHLRTSGQCAGAFVSRRVRMLAGVTAMTVLCFVFCINVIGKTSLADTVVEALSRIENVTYEIVETVDGEWETSTRVTVSGTERRRVELPDRQVLIVDTNKERQILLMPKEKRAVIRSAFPSDTISPVESPLMSLRAMREFATLELPRRMIEGKEVIGFVCNEGPYANLNVWVDPDTKLPVRMESSGENDSGEMVHEVIRNFVYNLPVDDSLFSVGVPVDYQADVQMATRTTSKPQTFQIVPGVGVGPLTFGITESKVVEILGEPRSKKPGALGQLLDYGAEGLRLEVSGEDGLRAIYCVSQASYGSSVRTFSAKTDKGIGIGASTEQVRAAYGEPVQEFHTGLSGVMMYVSPVVSFRFGDGKLSELVLLKPTEDK